MAIGDAGGGRGADHTISVPIVVHLGREGAARAERDAESAGARAGTAFGSRLALHALKRGVRLLERDLSASLHRLGETLKGPLEPTGLASVRRLAHSYDGLWDSLVLGVTRSQAFQGVMNVVARALERAAEWAAGLGRRIDRFAHEHAKVFAGFAGRAVGTLRMIATQWARVEAIFRAVAGAIAMIGGKVAQFVASVVRGVGVLADFVGFDRTSARMERLADEWGAVGAELSRLGGEQVTRGIEDFTDTLRDAAKGAADAQRAVEAFLANLHPERTATDTAAAVEAEKGAWAAAVEEAARERAKLDAEHEWWFGRQGSLLDSFRDLANGVGDSWADAAARIGGSLSALSEKARQAGQESRAAVAAAAGDMLAAFGAVGAQAEAAFGRSNRAAVVFQRVQLGIAAAVSTVQGFMAAGAAWKALGDNEPGQALAHLASAAAWFTAAGLAGARAGGLGGLGGGGRERGPREERVSEQVAPRQTQVTIVVEGNLIDNRDYVRNQLIPALRDAVREQDVVVTSSHVAGAGGA